MASDRNGKMDLSIGNRRKQFEEKIRACKQTNILTEYEEQFVTGIADAYYMYPDVWNPTVKQWNFLMGIQL